MALVLAASKPPPPSSPMRYRKVRDKSWIEARRKADKSQTNAAIISGVSVGCSRGCKGSQHYG
jgi:hypothetical protein